MFGEIRKNKDLENRQLIFFHIWHQSTGIEIHRFAAHVLRREVNNAEISKTSLMSKVLYSSFTCVV